MIRLLKSLPDIVEATNFLKKRGLLRHADERKNWDLKNIYEMLEGSDREIPIVDLGCGPSRYGCVTLNSLAKSGFSNLLGIDLFMPWYSRFFCWLAFVRHGILFRKYFLKKADLCSTGLPDSSMEKVIVLSVIEHGVPLEALMRELARILKPGGEAYISTDYWPDYGGRATDQTTGSRFGKILPWKVFNETDLRTMVEMARQHGLPLKEDAPHDWPKPQERCIRWRGFSYTFISFVFVKNP